MLLKWSLYYCSQRNSAICMCAQLFSCIWPCDPMDCSQSGSSVHGIFQARILEWVAIPSSWGSFWHRYLIYICCVSCIGRQILYHWAIREAPIFIIVPLIISFWTRTYDLIYDQTMSLNNDKEFMKLLEVTSFQALNFFCIAFFFFSMAFCIHLPTINIL